MIALVVNFIWNVIYYTCLQPGQETSADIAAQLGLTNIELEYAPEDFEALTNYKLFREHIQPLLVEQNPKASQVHTRCQGIC